MGKYPNEVHFPMSEDEKSRLLSRVKVLEKNGQKEEADKLLRSFPVLPSVAMSMKQSLGMEYLKARCINLYPAIEAFGEEWLENE